MYCYTKIRIVGLFSLFLSCLGYAQSQLVVDSPEYQEAKKAGVLDQYFVVPGQGSFDVNTNEEGFTQKNKPPHNDGTPKSGQCDCYQVPDASYTLALLPSDDGSSDLITLPFTFTFYGQSFTSLYINNNGNITFGSSLSSYTSSDFYTRQIIAPFWADVDTRNGNGSVTYKIVGNAIYINWHNVGYYSQKGDKRNSFQLVLTNGADPAVPDGNNVAFCYQQMQWTTGSVSCGSNLSCSYGGNSYSCSTDGFCGIPATAGISKGFGSTGPHFLVGMFDHPGTDFDGPLGNNDGVGYLSNKTFYFNTTHSTNIPPIPYGISACDTFHICTFGDTADVKITFMSPELDQTTTISYTTGTLGTDVQELYYTSGNFATLGLRVIGTPENEGIHELSITATDNLGASTTIPYTIHIDTLGSTLNPQLSYTTACGSFEVHVENGPYDGYLWDDLSETPTSFITETGIYGVTVHGNNCHKRVETYIYVPQKEPFNLQGELYLCPGENETLITVGDSLSINFINWGSNPGPTSIVNTYSAWFTPGVYTISNQDTSGFCNNDTTFMIGQAVASSIFSDTLICNNLNFSVTGSVLGTTAYWSSPNPEISFSNAYTNNTIISASQYGIYQIVVPNPCQQPDSLRATIIFSGKPVLFPNDTTCELSYQVNPPISTLGGTWTSYSPANIISISNDTIPNPTFTSVLAPYTAIFTYTDKYCPVPATNVSITFFDLKVNVPNFACELSTSDISTNGLTGGIWQVIDEPSTVLNEADQATFSPSNQDTSPTLSVTTPGTYTVRYTDNFCDFTHDYPIIFHTDPIKQLTDTSLCAGELVMLSAQQPHFTATYQWNTGETTPSITTTKGEYHTVTISNDCYTIIDSSFVHRYSCDINAPNVLSLSSNTGNNLWAMLDTEGIQEFSCIITNRWGNVIYELNDIHASWNGTDKKGNKVNEGVYFYLIDAKAIGGVKIEKSGFITVVH